MKSEKQLKNEMNEMHLPKTNHKITKFETISKTIATTSTCQRKILRFLLFIHFFSLLQMHCTLYTLYCIQSTHLLLFQHFVNNLLLLFLSPTMDTNNNWIWIRLFRAREMKKQMRMNKEEKSNVCRRNAMYTQVE